MSNTLKYINIVLESWGVLICIAVLAVVFIESKIEKHTGRHFISIFICLLIDLLCNIAGLLTKGMTSSLGWHLVRISNFGEFFSGFLLSFLFSLYILHVLGGRENKKLRVWYIVASVIALLGEALVIISQFTGWLYVIDADSMYHRGEFFWLSSVLAVTSLLANIIVIFLHRKSLKKRECTALTAYSCIMVLASLASLLFYGIFFILLGSVVVAFLMLTVSINGQIKLVKSSIKNKINYLISGSMLTLAILLLSITLLISGNISSQNAEIMMRESCYSLALKLNDQLNLVELTVNNLYDISEKSRPSLEELKDETIVSEYMDQMEEIAVSAAYNTDGAVAVYYRLNPDITGNGISGFFCTRSGENGRFQKLKPTDLNVYDVNDTEHVGWYYLPVWAGKPIWTEPYDNANINVKMVSYAIPVYDGSDLVGVIGMDIDFTKFEEILDELNIYKSSGVALGSMSNSEIHYQKGNLLGNSFDSDIYSQLQSREQSEEIQFINRKGEKYGIYFTTLENHMKLVTYARASDMNSQLYSIIVIGVMVFLIVFAITLILSLRLSRNMVKPLFEVIEATKQYAVGNWDAKVSCNAEDEIGELADNITIMANETKEYISKLKNLAEKDGLTGLRNRNDYLMYIEKCIGEEVWADCKMAVVVMDVNNLKKVNDNLGHEKGDELLQKAGKFICQTFSHSSVFRIGGDEFVAIADGTDFDMIDRKMRDFHHHMEAVSGKDDIMEVCIASGMAKLGMDGDTYDAVFKVADERMYRNKVEIKNGMKPR